LTEDCVGGVNERAALSVVDCGALSGCFSLSLSLSLPEEDKYKRGLLGDLVGFALAGTSDDGEVLEGVGCLSP